MTELVEKVYKAALEIAHLAGATIVEETGHCRDVEFKGPTGIRDMVTVVDKASEKVIIGEIQKRFPHHGIFAEESGCSSDDFGDDNECIWFIDPIDGTTNFVHQFPYYCVSIGVQAISTGQIIVGVVYDVIHNEMFSAKENGGAFLNGDPISVSKAEKLEETILGTGFPYVHDKVFDLNMELWKDIYKKTQGLRRAGAAALDLCYVACGRLDGFWEFYLKPWDQAAACLIIAEAGGTITCINGCDFDVYKQQILAANPAIHRNLLKLLCNYDIPKPNDFSF